MTATVEAADLQPTWFIDADHADVQAFARNATTQASTPSEVASALFAAVRDHIRYDPYAFDLRPEAMRASAVLRSERNWCVPKSTLLAAACRALEVPARVGFADVRNHLSSEKLEQLMGTDVFAYHGYTAIHLDGRWWKATPAFNAELCERFGVPPLEFDGTADALLHAHDGQGRRHMEYLTDHGTFADLPLERITAELQRQYPGFADAVAARREHELATTHDAAFHGDAEAAAGSADAGS